MAAGLSAHAVPSRDAHVSATVDRVVPLSVTMARTPRVRVPHVVTRGTYPQVTRLGINLTLVNAALRKAVVDDQLRFAAQVPKNEARLKRPVGNYGVYETIPTVPLISASSVVVSALVPTFELLPAGVDGQWWLSVTVRVSDARGIAIGDLFSLPPRGRRVVATAARRALSARNWCIRASLADPVVGRDFLNGFSPTARHYRFFALTSKGLMIGFPVGQVGGPACGRVMATVPYAVVRPYLSALGRELVGGVRRPN